MPGTMLDIFASDPFSVRSMTDSVNKLPRKPGKIGQLGLFRAMSSPTTTVAIGEKQGVLSLIPTSSRGGPGKTISDGTRIIRDLRCSHIKVTDGILAERVQNVRAEEGENALQPFVALVNDTLQTINDSLDATLEFHYAGALQGVVKDADADFSTIYNLYTEFGVTAFGDVDFVLGTGSTDVAGKCTEVNRLIKRGLGNMTMSGVTAFAGPAWWDKFVKHDEVKWAFQALDENRFARDDMRETGFVFKGIRFFEYTDEVAGTPFIAPDKVRFFPTGADIYRVVYGPADWVETVNTMGRPRYAKQEPMKMGRGIEVEVQSNPLVYVTHPRALVGGTTSN